MGGIGGRGGIEMVSASTPSQGHHFSPHSTAKTNHKSTNLRKNGSSGISDVVRFNILGEPSEEVDDDDDGNDNYYYE